MNNLSNFSFIQKYDIRSHITIKYFFQNCMWFTNPCGRQCEGTSHQPVGSVLLTSTEAPLPPPAHTRVESADLQKWRLFLNFGNKMCFPLAKKFMHSILVCVLKREDYSQTDHSTKWAKGKWTSILTHKVSHYAMV